MSESLQANEVPELTVEQRFDWIANALNELHLKVDNQTRGITAIYQGVDGLVKMLSAVQQVASMMPGPAGKMIRSMAKRVGADENAGQ